MHPKNRGFRGVVPLLLGLIAPFIASADEPAILNHAPGIRHSAIEQAGPDMPRADTASVVELPGGDLFVVYHKYDGAGTAHDMAVCRIWAKTSHDDGKTWVEPRLLVDVAPGDMNVWIPAIVRLPNGELLLTCARTHNHNSTTQCVFRSRDNGKTFTEEEPIWKHSEAMQQQGGAGSLVLLKSGRIVFPYSFGLPGQDTRKLNTRFYLSDDMGHTWRQSPATIELPRRGADEPSLAELENGDLVVSLRTDLGGPYLSYSHDRGETWTNAEPAGCPPSGGFPLQGPESCTCLRRIPGTNAIMIIWNNSTYVPIIPGLRHVPGGTGHFGKRTPLTAAISCDGGNTWVIAGDIASGPEDQYTNPNCTFNSKGQAIITYFTGHLTKPWPISSPHRASLWCSVADPSWYAPALAKAQALASAPPPVYHVPGADDPKDKPKP